MSARGRSTAPLATALVATAAALAPASSSGRGRSEAHDAACRRALDDPEAVEAQEWLRTPPGPNRLGRLSTNEGLALLDRLQEHGSARVVVVGLHRAARPDAGQSADGLAVALPSDPVRRRLVFDLYAKQVRAAGYAPRADDGQGCLFIAF
jgi:hypothetical protein